MATTIPLEEAQVKLRELIHRLAPGEEIIITENQQPVAKLVSQPPSPQQPRVPGNCRGMIHLLVEDEEHLKDFQEYMA
jgi:antitoxin (DNA-binding transcriptional repressor) of toxin-antitoxin stability system